MKNSNIYNNKMVQTWNQPQFFGEQLNIARNDIIKYTIFEELYNAQVSYFWRPEEISLQKDISDWQSLDPVSKRIFEKNLAYQILLDSVQERAISIALLPYTSIPELEQLFTVWSFFEQIHSKSYQYILKNMFNNPSEVFDEVLNDEQIRSRAESVIKFYDDFIECAQSFKNNFENMSPTESYELHKKLYLCLVNIYLLESVRFYVSFACSFYFAHAHNILKGNANIISLIARDEKLHCAMTLNIINNYKRKENNSIMLRVMKDSEPQVKAMFAETIAQEEEWVRYLFKDGPLMSFNEDILIEYLHHIAGQRMKNLGLENIYKNVRHPIGWVESWLNPKNKQSAPQEQELIEYLSGAVTVENFDLQNYEVL